MTKPSATLRAAKSVVVPLPLVVVRQRLARPGYNGKLFWVRSNA